MNLRALEYCHGLHLLEWHLPRSIHSGDYINTHTRAEIYGRRNEDQK